MAKSATITVQETAGEPAPAAETAPAVIKAKAEAIRTLAVETKAIRRDVYSNDG